MIPLIRLKKDLFFNGELARVVDVLKGVAAARYHVLERQGIPSSDYEKVAEEILTLTDLRDVEHPFVRQKSSRTGVLLITSDTGFLGGLNAQVVSAGLQEAGPEGSLTVIGDCGVDLLKGGHQSHTAFQGISDSARLSLAVQVRDHLVREILLGHCGRFVVVYPQPISFAVQKVALEPLFPVTEWIPTNRFRRLPSHVLWESSLADIVEYVGAERTVARLDGIFAVSRLAELAARAVHLEGSSQELIRQGKKIRLQYFRARHEWIDRSMREIFSSQLLYGKTKNEG